MKKPFTKLLYIPLSLALITPISAQDLTDILKDLAENNAKGYLAPVVTAFGTGMNSGTFHRAKPHKILGFDLTVNATVIGIPEAGKEFEFVIPDRDLPAEVTLPGGGTYIIPIPFNTLYSSDNPEDYMVPTFFGDTDGGEIPVNTTATRAEILAELATQSGQSTTWLEANAGAAIDTAMAALVPLPTPGGVIPAFFTAMPQFSIGLPMNVEITFRGIKTQIEGDDVQFGGFGAKVGFSEFIPLFPLALSAGFYSTNLIYGDQIEAKNTIMTLQASKSIPIITVYGGIGLESSSMSVDYRYEPEGLSTPIDVSFDLEGDNKTRIIAGLRLKLAVLSFHFDINSGEYTAYNAGVGFTLR